MRERVNALLKHLRGLRALADTRVANLSHFLNQTRGRHPLDLPREQPYSQEQLPLKLRQAPGLPGQVHPSLPLPPAPRPPATS